MEIQLTQEAIDIIKGNQALFYNVRKVLKTGDGRFMSESNLYKNLTNNTARLTEVAVLNVIVEHTGKPLSTLITGGKLSKLMGT